MTSQYATHNKSCKPPCVFARGRLSDREGDSARLIRVFVEQYGKVVAVNVSVELARNVPH